MTFEDAKGHLRENYERAGLSFVDEHRRELYMQLGKHTCVIDQEEISEFASSFPLSSAFSEIPNQCSICSTNYREQVVRRIDTGRSRIALSATWGDYIFGDSSSDLPYVKLGVASTTFVNYFRFKEPYLRICKERNVGIHRIATQENDRNRLLDRLYRPRTIQVYNLSEQSVESAARRSTDLIESCLFGLSYLKGQAYSLVEEWPSPGPISTKRPFSLEGRLPGNRLPLPAVSYKRDLIRFYQFGISTDIPVLQFLTFYQVLEFFFINVSDEQLYAKLSARINDLRFRTVPNDLDRLIQDVLDHTRTTDETEMLKAVIAKYVDEDELIAFIREYEEYLGGTYYSKKHEIFGVDVEVKLVSGHVIGNVAKIIKTVRNALVHSSDRHERGVRHVPFSKSTEIVEREVPLVKFLAEKVINATAFQRS